MSDIRRDSAWWLWTNLPQLAAAAGLCVLVLGGFTYLFGGFQPKLQTDLTDARDRLARLEAKMDTLPRSKDFSDWEGHLSKLDGRADGLEHRMSEGEYGIRDLVNKYGSLTSTGARK